MRVFRDVLRRTALARALLAALPFAIASACTSQPNTIDLLPVASTAGGDGADGATTPPGTCGGDADCPKGAPFCNLERQRCEECMTSADCPLDEVCRAETHSCEPRCQANADCVGIDRPVCSATGVCVECTMDVDCGGATPRCNPLNGVCVQCLVTADCGGSTRCIDDCLVCVANACVWRT
jgi:hypothetical protein